MKIKAILLIIVSLILNLGFTDKPTQTTLEGKVIDKKSGSPLDFAYVKLFQKGKFITGTQTDMNGNYTISNLTLGVYDIEASYIGYEALKKTNFHILEGKNTYNFALTTASANMDCISIKAYKAPLIGIENTITGGIVTAEKITQLPTKSVNAITASTAGISSNNRSYKSFRGGKTTSNAIIVDGIKVKRGCQPSPSAQNEESYELPQENSFNSVASKALSTFSIDVDRAAYSNIRRFINSGRIPPSDAIRIEEMINYFDYEYDVPKDENIFHVFSDITSCPWNKEHQILHLALNTKTVEKKKLTPSNLVFLIDVSGSMRPPNKLPLVISSFKHLLNQLRPEDKVAIVVYAGAAGCVLQSTKVSEKQKIYEALEKLRARGSTAGGAGIKLAYKIAKENFIADGNNRVILATDGDFNVGAGRNPDALEKLISQKRNDNIFLSVLGFGMGNYKSDMVQRLADKGNGNHAYIDNMNEARKVFVKEFPGTLYTLAKDVKIQIEFNPAFVQAYRLIGYENRMLKKEDFNNDKIDAGEIGIGHSVTALYEIIPVGSESSFIGKVDDLVFQEKEHSKILNTTDLGFFKIRYKEPKGEKSKKIQFMISPDVVDIDKANQATKFAVSVAQFGLLIKDSQYKQDASYESVLKYATTSKGKDSDGMRAEFINLVKTAKEIQRSIAKN